MLLLTIHIVYNSCFFNVGNIFAGIALDTKQHCDEVGRLDRLEEQNSVKQSLISSYKRNLYPTLKEEVSRTFPQDQTVIRSRTNSLTSKSGILLFITNDTQLLCWCQLS